MLRDGSGFHWRPSKAEPYRASIVKMLTDEPELLSVEVYRRVKLAGYEARKSALYELIRSVREHGSKDSRSLESITALTGILRGKSDATAREMLLGLAEASEPNLALGEWIVTRVCRRHSHGLVRRSNALVDFASFRIARHDAGLCRCLLIEPQRTVTIRLVRPVARKAPVREDWANVAVEMHLSRVTRPAKNQEPEGNTVQTTAQHHNRGL